MNIKTFVIACLTLFSGYAVATPEPISAQSGAVPRFEVASVKPSDEAAAGSVMPTTSALPGGRFIARQAVLRVILQNAYQVRAFQIVGAPGWINSAKYDIDAKADNPNATLQQLESMLQPLLAEKFKLIAHHETRELPIYELVPAKAGLKLTQAKQDGCIPGNPLNSPPPRPGEKPVCGQIRGSAGAAASIDGRQVTMSDLIRTLSAMVGRTVIDKTGYAGTFDVHLSFTRDEALAGLGVPDVTTAPDPSSSSIFIALQEQLGLQLNGAKGPVDVIIIDHIERPVGN